MIRVLLALLRYVFRGTFMSSAETTTLGDFAFLQNTDGATRELCKYNWRLLGSRHRFESQETADMRNKSEYW